MKSGLRHAKLRWQAVLNPILISLALCCLFNYVECRWCTKIQSYKTVRTTIQPSKCNESYQDSCGWFTQKQCTYYEIVDCLLQKNHTVLRYRMSTECCAGFKLDPEDNITCIEDSESSTLEGLGYSPEVKPKPPTTDKNAGKGRGSGLDEATEAKPPPPTHENTDAKKDKNEADKKTDTIPLSTNKKADKKEDNKAVSKLMDTGSTEPVDNETSGDDRGNLSVAATEGSDGDGGSVPFTTRPLVTCAPKPEDNTVNSQPVQQDDDDGLFLNLSSGAYTGIICAFVFILCVLILIGLHLWKKQRRLKKKTTENSVEMDVTQKMLTFSPKA